MLKVHVVLCFCQCSHGSAFSWYEIPGLFADELNDITAAKCIFNLRVPCDGWHLVAVVSTAGLILTLTIIAAL